MAVYKCQACGANLEITRSTGIVECEYCGTRQTVAETAGRAAGDAENLLKRGDLALEDRKWNEAKVFFDRVLDIDAEEPRAYIGKLLAGTGYSSLDELWQAGLWNKVMAIDDYKKACRFGDEDLKRMLDEYTNKYIYRTAEEKFRSGNVADIKEALSLFTQIIDYRDSGELTEKCKDKIYSHALLMMNEADSEGNFLAAKSEFELISGYSDSDAMAEECASKAELARKNAIYDNALKYENSDNIGELSLAARQFESIPDHKDSKEKAEHLRARLRRMQSEADEARRQAELRNQEFMHKETEKQLREEERKKKIKIIVAAAIVLIIAVYFVVSLFVVSDSGNDETAAADSVQEIIEKKPPEYYAAIREKLPKGTISAGELNSAGVRADGTIYYTIVGDLGWTDITAVSAGHGFIAGLKTDGTVVAYNNTDFRYVSFSDVSDWTDIVDISAGLNYIAGLRSDGTVVTARNYRDDNFDLSEWTDIVAISAGFNHIAGLKSDGTVITTGSYDVSDWTDIVAISAGYHYIAGLRSDGTVVKSEDSDQYWNKIIDVSDWYDIVAVSTGSLHIVGLKSDGTVVAVGDNNDGQCDVSDWTDIVAVSAGDYYTLGLKSDGTVVAIGNNNAGRCNVQDWSDIKTAKD